MSPVVVTMPNGLAQPWVLHPAVEAVDGFDHGPVILGGHVVGDGVARAAGITAAGLGTKREIPRRKLIRFSLLGEAPVRF